MALLFCDSFDNYTSPIQKWTLNGSGGIGAYGRFGTNGLQFGSLLSTGSASVGWLAPSAFQTWIVGTAVHFTNVTGNNLVQPISIRDGGTVQVDVYYDLANQKLLVRRGGSGGTTLITSTRTIVTGTYYYIELKVTIDNAGSCELWIDGVQDGTFSGDTQQSANASADRLYMAAQSNLTGGLICRFDDVYVLNSAGDPLKDPRIECLFPTGNGNSSQLVGSDGNSVDNYLLVDEATPNDDTDYVQSMTVGDKDTYAFGDLTTTAGTVYGVQIAARARKTWAGARSIASLSRLSATEEASADIALSTTYATLLDMRETKPGGGAWTVSDVNNAEFGVKVSA